MPASTKIPARAAAPTPTTLTPSGKRKLPFPAPSPSKPPSERNRESYLAEASFYDPGEPTKAALSRKKAIAWLVQNDLASDLKKPPTVSAESRVSTFSPTTAIGAPPSRMVKPPPWVHDNLRNLDAERIVIAAMLLNKAVIPEVLAEIEGPEDFSLEAHREVFVSVMALSDSGKPIGLVTLADDLDHRNALDKAGGVDFVKSLLTSAASAGFSIDHARIVREKAIKRGIVAHAEETIREVHANGKTSFQLLELASGRLAKVEARTSRDEDGPTPVAWPDPLRKAALHGVMGDLVAMIEPHTESDPASILVQLLVAFSNVIGRGPHWNVESSRHGLNLFACIAGNSAKARKGTSWDVARWVLSKCEPEWATKNVCGGLTSGEGMIWEVRDKIMRRERVDGRYEEREVDPGVEDKRVLWVEPEFGRTLTACSRDGSTLGDVIRQAWDGLQLRTAAKNSPARATRAHISVIGHITCEELTKKLSRTDAANGFANRFLWVCARRSKFLPHGGRIFEVNFDRVIARLNDVIGFAAETLSEDGPAVARDEASNRLWEKVYPTLSEPKPGLLGSVTSRAEAQVMRLATIYAVLDQSRAIRTVHLEAGLALWRYCEQSASYLFGASLADADAERLLEALKAAGPRGLTLTDVRRKVFGGRMKAHEYSEKLSKLSSAGLALLVTDPNDPKKMTWVASASPSS